MTSDLFEIIERASYDWLAISRQPHQPLGSLQLSCTSAELQRVIDDPLRGKAKSFRLFVGRHPLVPAHWVHDVLWPSQVGSGLVEPALLDAFAGNEYLPANLLGLIAADFALASPSTLAALAGNMACSSGTRMVLLNMALERGPGSTNFPALLNMAGNPSTEENAGRLILSAVAAFLGHPEFSDQARDIIGEFLWDEARTAWVTDEIRSAYLIAAACDTP